MGKKKTRRPITGYESVKTALSGLAGKSRDNYLTAIQWFCEFVGRDPDQIIAERKEHIRSDDEKVQRTYERKVMEFYEHLKKRMKESSAFVYAGGVRGFFSRNYLPKMIFRRGDLRTPNTKSSDYIPTMGEIKETVDAADIRDKAIIIFDLQTGLSPIDLVNLERPEIETAIRRGEFPCALGWFKRGKTRVEFHPFLFADSARALKVYLQNRADDDPWLFVERGGGQLSERNVNDIFQKAAERAGIAVPPGRRLRVYCLRSVFETQMGNAGMPQTWIDMMMGHTVGGARGKYVKPPEADWLEKARMTEPFVSVSRVRNMDAMRGDINEARRGDMLQLILMLEKELGRDAMMRLAEGYLALKPKPLQQLETRAQRLDEKDLLPPEHVMAGALDEYLTLSGRPPKKIF